MDTYNRKDNDGHKFNIPDELLTEWDDLFLRYTSGRYKESSNEYFELESKIYNKFNMFMVG